MLELYNCELAKLEFHYGCHTGSVSLTIIQSLDGAFQGCLYTIDDQPNDGVYCFKENGDYPSECLIGKVSHFVLRRNGKILIKTNIK